MLPICDTRKSAAHNLIIVYFSGIVDSVPARELYIMQIRYTISPRLEAGLPQRRIVFTADASLHCLPLLHCIAHVAHRRLSIRTVEIETLKLRCIITKKTSIHALIQSSTAICSLHPLLGPYSTKAEIRCVFHTKDYVKLASVSSGITCMKPHVFAIMQCANSTSKSPN